MQQAGVPLRCPVKASHCGGFSTCRTQVLGRLGFRNCSSWAPEYRLSSDGGTGLASPRHVGSAWIGAQTCVLCLGRQILHHGAAREAPPPSYFPGSQLSWLVRMVTGPLPGVSSSQRPARLPQEKSLCSEGAGVTRLSNPTTHCWQQEAQGHVSVSITSPERTAATPAPHPHRARPRDDPHHCPNLHPLSPGGPYFSTPRSVLSVPSLSPHPAPPHIQS